MVYAMEAAARHKPAQNAVYAHQGIRMLPPIVLLMVEMLAQIVAEDQAYFFEAPHHDAVAPVAGVPVEPEVFEARQARSVGASRYSRRTRRIYMRAFRRFLAHITPPFSWGTYAPHAVAARQREFLHNRYRSKSIGSFAPPPCTTDCNTALALAA